MQEFDLEEELKKLPEKPGVYIMHDSSDHILYVGKAVILKNRVRQYFQKSYHTTEKIRRMIEQIQWFEYIVTDSELEALVLECNLIKEYNPKYNTLLKDGKGYPFLRVTLHEDFPRFVFARKMKNNGDKYYGPFTSSTAIRDSIDLINRLFYIRSCHRKLPEEIGKGRPCLYYEMGRCKAPCMGYQTKEEYGKYVKQGMDLLNGDTGKIIRRLQEQMERYSQELAFEEAGKIRDQIQSIEHVTQRQNMLREDRDDLDIIAMAHQEGETVVQVFFLRNGKMIGREHYYITGTEEETEEHILGEFLKQMYAGTPYIPRELLTEVVPEDEEAITRWLREKRGHRVTIRQPQRGQKVRLLNLAKENARMVLERDAQKMKLEYEKTVGALKDIGRLLNLPDLNRIESYDISNINGFETVGSMVVYEEGRPKKNDYRKFRIRSVTGPDDYHAMEEMLRRRFSHGILDEKEKKKTSFSSMPDVLFMDGGKGQMHMAQKVLKEWNLDIPVCGMVKDDRHRTRALLFEDQEIPMDPHSRAFRLVTRIQDETHRFAIEYHRQIRKKGQVHSVLDDIPSIGPARRRALMRYYSSLEDIKEATVEELSEIPEMTRRSAEEVVRFFQEPSQSS